MTNAKRTVALLVLGALFGAAGCGADGSDAAADAEPAVQTGNRAAAGDRDAGARKHATATLGDNTWSFSPISCVIIRSEEYVQSGPDRSDDGTVVLSATHEPEGRTAVGISAEDGSFQYSVGEGGRRKPGVTIDGRAVTFEGTFVNEFDSTDQVEGSVELRC